MNALNTPDGGWIAQTQEWSDCRLVVAANAALMFGLDPPRPDRNRGTWEHLVDVAGARHGSAITPSVSDRKMGVVALRYASPWATEDLLPATCLSIHDPQAGFHCVLVAAHTVDGLGLLGYEWLTKVKWLTRREVEKLLPAPGNINRRADLFVRREQSVKALARISYQSPTVV